MATRYHGSYEGIGEHILRAPWMVELMHAKAEAVKARAEAIAPVYARGPHPGRYKAAFSVSSGIRETGRTRRAYGRVSNDAPEALAVEFGTRHNPAHHTLVKALDAIPYSGGSAAASRNTPRR